MRVSINQARKQPSMIVTAPSQLECCYTDDDARRGRPPSPPPWADLPNDALGEVARRLHDAADFVRFHAVCRPWRDAAPPPPPTFLPCLIGQDDGAPQPRSLLRLHSPFSRTTTRNPPPSWKLAALGGKMLESPDTAGGRVVALGCSHNGDRTAMLIDPLTGDATSLPPLPQHISPGNAHKSTSGVACANGAIVLHTRLGVRTRLAAVVLRSGETDWEDIDVTRAMEVYKDTLYPDESILRPRRCARPVWGDRYVIESQGELLCIDVKGMGPPFTVSVHALEVRSSQWVEREHGRGIGDHMCLFLDRASKTGFAIDARELTGGEVTGGSAYFVRLDWIAWWQCMYAVYRYSFKDGTATVAYKLPFKPMWYMPRPRISQLRS
ncbi:hypothetical protein ACP70R_001285 [Stipagrostis hirtigluma subsp. patula]